MTFYAHKLAHQLNLKPGMKVLDIGCGIGGPAREIATFTGCEIVGLTINQGQVDRAILLTAMEGLSGKCTFVKGIFLDMPFMDGGFDAAYAIEATCYAPSLAQVYKEVARVVKPGGGFATMEWVLTPNFDPKNERHARVRNRIERGHGLVNLHTSEQARDALQEAGFEISHEEDFVRHFDYAKDLVEENSRQRNAPSRQSQEVVRFESPILIPYRSGLSPAPRSTQPLPHALPIPDTLYRP